MGEELRGYTTLVTRPPRQAPALQRLIEARGGQARVLPLIKPVRVSDWEDQIQYAQAHIWNWIVFTSANAVTFFDDIYTNHDIAFSPDFRVAAVGRKTAEVLEQMGWAEPIVPEHYSAEGLADLLQANVKEGENVLFPKSARARHVIPDALRRAGADCCELPLYTSTPAVENKQTLREWVKKEELDFLTFTSPSSVQAFASFMEELNPKWKEIPLVSIGTITDEAAARSGFLYRRTADPSTIEGLVNTLTAFSKEDV
ncbi:uroporphyrinogen-III synthase [Salibacterium aidingense]|uniref:uroporphyrinogen-III synthase n=1 Tax=Salibacterium aidingense TaxID=384933 RepID=UPI003BC7EC2E